MNFAEVEAIADALAARLNPGPWLTLTEAASYLRHSPAWVEKRLDEIPHHRPPHGRKLLFNAHELDSWITNHTEE